LAADKRKILEAARKHAQKGAKDKALNEYAKLLKLEPRDSKLRLEIGDAHRRWGQVDEAIDAYAKVAEHFMNEGFDARAVAVFKQIQNLDADTFSFHEPLAELYQRMGLTAEAIGCLESAADGHYRAGQKQAALGLLRKMATIDPSNTTSRIKVADLLHQEGLTEDAIAEYDEVVAELEQGNDTERIDKVFERILEINPDRVTTLGRYAKHLIARDLPERAEPLATRALELDKSPEHYELLADVYRLEKRDQDLVTLYRGLAELYRQRGDEERTREILQRYVPLDTMDTPEPSNGYIDPNEISDEDPLLDDLGLGDDTMLLDEDLLSDESLLVSDGDSGFGLLSPEGESDVLVAEGPTEGSNANELTRIMPDLSSDGRTRSGNGGASRNLERSSNPDQLLAEASVYLRYGKRDQAIANLESILARDPDHPSALEKLGEAHAEGGDTARAVEFWSRAARLVAKEGSSEQASVLRNRIAALDPAAAEALDLVATVEPDLGYQNPLPLDDLFDPPDAKASVSEDDLEQPSDDSFQSPDVPGGPGFDFPEIDLGDIEIDVDAASFTEIPADEQPPMLLDEPVTVDDTPLGDDAAEQEVDSNALTTAGPGAGASGSAQFTEDLEEADFYLQQGLLDEAEAVYTRLLSTAPNHPLALVRLGEVAAQRGQDPGSTAAPVGLAEAMAAHETDVSEEPAVADLGQDLADWHEESSAHESIATGEFDLPDESLISFDDGEDFAVGDGDLSAEQSIAVDQTDVPEERVDTGLGADLRGGLDDVAGGNSPIRFEFSDEVDANATTLSGATAASSDQSIEPTEEPVEKLVDEPAAPAGAPSPLATTSVDLDDEPDVADADDEPGFDLGAELSQALDGDPGSTASGASKSGKRGDTSDDGFASVFAEFKKGVSETLSDGDHQARYDLGIAYREMGLLGDAMSELQVAMKDPVHRVGSLQLMALCSLDLGEPEQATGYLQDALSTPDLSDECVLSLQLDLGKSYEAAGDIESARTALQEVYARDPNFGDVESRLTELEARAEKEKPADELETRAESEESADDLDAAGIPNTSEYETFDGFLDDLDEDDDEEEAVQATSGAEGDATESKSWETFDDVIAEAQSDDEEPSSPVSEMREPVDSFEVIAESEEIVDMEEEDAVEPEAEDVPATRSRKKKISFV
jgi:pilus assembly protein FimV